MFRRQIVMIGLAISSITIQTSIAQTWFTDVAVDFGVDAGDDRTWSCSWADYDKDGDEDLLITNAGQPYFTLFKNNFPDPFIDESAIFDVPLDYFSYCAVWGDYDNDGDLDVYFCQGAGGTYPAPNKLYRNDGSIFTDVTDIAGVGNEGISHSAAWGDYDLDGDLDLYVANYYCENYGYLTRNELYHNNGNGTFTAVGIDLGVADEGTVVIPYGASFLDFNDDGYPDIYVAKTLSQGNRLFKNYQGEAFEDVAPALGVDVPDDETWSLGAGDFDNDGDLDLYIPVMSNTDDPSWYNHLFEFDQGVFMDVAEDWRVQGPIYNASNADSYFPDFDNDGDWDLHVLGTWGSHYSDLLFEKRPLAPYYNATSESGLGDTDRPGISVAWADFNRDGREDCYVGNSQIFGDEDWANRLFVNQYPEPGKYLHISLIGAESNEAAIGAKVYVRLPDATRLRKDYGFTSGRSQASLPVEFGCKNFSTVDSVLVYWPSGDTSIFEDVATNQRITIVEHGYFANHDMVWDHNLYGHYYISGDVLIGGMDLQVNAGTHIYFHKSWATNDRPKLLIGPNGSLTASGTLSNPVVFTSQHPSPQAGDWEGIQGQPYLGYSLSISMNFARISYASSGFYWVDSEATRPASLSFNNCRFTDHSSAGIDLAYPSIIQANITNCYFQDCDNYGIRVRKDIIASDPEMIIRADTILDCRFGIHYTGSSNPGYTKKPLISNCVIERTVPSALDGYGIFVSSHYASGPRVSPWIERDSIVGFYGGIKLVNVNSNCKLVANKVKGNSNYGIYLKSASPNIVPSILGNPNVFNSSRVGMYCDKYSSPYVRTTKIKENLYRGVLVDATWPPDFGTALSHGGNSIHTEISIEPYADMQYTVALPQLSAVGNWWGEYPPDRFEIIGNINYSEALGEDPLPGYEKREASFAGLPDGFGLQQNFPNPFNPITSISLYLAEPGFASLKIYNLNGQLVNTLVSDHMGSGEHTVIWDSKNSAGREVSSGIYFYILDTDYGKASKKMVLLR